MSKYHCEMCERIARELQSWVVDFEERATYVARVEEDEAGSEAYMDVVECLKDRIEELEYDDE